MTARRFPPPWSVEELNAMTRSTKSKVEAIKLIIRQLEQIAISGKTKNRKSKLMKAGC
jgi:hypothetical protein